MKKTNYTNHKYGAEVIKVLNGNTIMARIDLGFNKTHECAIGLFEPDSNEHSIGSVEKLTEILQSNKNQIDLIVLKEFNSGGVIGTIYAGYTDVYPWYDSMSTRPIMVSVNDLLIEHAAKLGNI
tara:strand:- start:2908 stop:3279 length:372 start_codon:yes stop_codon:yes gene_type:complete